MVDADAFALPERAASSPEVSYFKRNELEELRRLVSVLVAQLPEQERALVRSHYLQEISFDQIAEGMGITRGRVSQIHRRALLLLQAALSRSKAFDQAW